MAKELLPKLSVCQNCETPTPGNYCPECGQDSREHRVSLRLLAVGLWHDLFTFDNRFWRSLVLLLFKPGVLTERFVTGWRVRYIPPARMYLFISLVFFFLMTTLIEGEMREHENTPDADAEAPAALADSILTAVSDTLQVTLDDAPGEFTTEFLDGLQDGIAGAAEENAGEDDGRARGTALGREFDLDEQTLVGAVIGLLPKGMFLLLPLFAALLKLVYVRSGRRYVEHLIFSLHFHSFVFILLTAALLSLQAWVWLVAFGLFYVYLYLAMKRVYGQGWGKTWLKHFLLTNAYNIVFFAFIVLVMAGGVHLAELAEKYPRWLGWAV